MSGYAAAARIERARPRVVEREPDERGERRWAEMDAALFAATTTDGPADDRWAAFRDRWSQLTFFLLHPESWR
jgi:hypothetical protein